jgi:hypothetical protein
VPVRFCEWPRLKTIQLLASMNCEGIALAESLFDLLACVGPSRLGRPRGPYSHSVHGVKVVP